MTQNRTDEALDRANEQGMEETADSPAQNAEQAGQGDGAANAAPGSGSRLGWLLRSTLVRIVGLIFIVFILVLVVGGLIYSSTRSQRGQQLPVSVYPNATQVSKRATANSETEMWATTAPFQVVYDFYVKQIAVADGSGCQKVYSPPVQSEDPGKVAGKCYVLNAFQDANQTLSVSIQTQLTADGKPDKTVIEIDRSWKG